MTELSPAAQAVMGAYYKGLEATSSDCATEEDALAAALRAAADRARRGPEHREGSYPDDYDNGWNEAVAYLTTIADELENINDH